jgi:tetratricopeptide (TPR) repeat protein
MSRLKRLIREAHQRSLWQALVVYLGASYGVLEAVQLFRDEFGLPDWLLPVALVLLLIGLPVVIVTSLAKEEVYGDEVPKEHAEAAAEEDRRLRFLTWRTAGFALVGVLAVWGLVAAGWVVLGGTGFLITRAAAADFVESRDCIVVAEFEDETEGTALGLTVRTLVVTDIGQTPYVNVLGDERLRETLELMRLPDTTHVDQHLALEIAQRDNCPAVVAGTVAPLGTSYLLSAQILEVATGQAVVPLSEPAVNDSALYEAAQRLARLVRRHLGESLSSIQRSEPLRRVTTSSLEALELFSQAAGAIWRGDPEGAIPLLEQAVDLDTAFAAAYSVLGGAYNMAGRRNEGYRSAELAYRFAERVPLVERFRVIAQYYQRKGRVDSSAHYLRVCVERYPDICNNNLGLRYDALQRYEDALAVWLEWDCERPEVWLGCPVNMARTARSLGRHRLADSALAILSAKVAPGGGGRSPGRGPGSLIWVAAWNAYYAGDLLLADSLASVMANNSVPRVAAEGRDLRAGLAAMYGRMDEALALAGNDGFGSLFFIEVACLAAGTPERALAYVDSARSQLTLGTTYPLDEYRSLGRIAYGYALAGETHSARELLAVQDSFAENNDVYREGLAERVLAAIALQEGRAEDAVQLLGRAKAADFGRLWWDRRALLAEARAALGNLDEAIAQYDTLTGTYRLSWSDRFISFPLRPLAHERLGSLYLQVGDTVSAARHLSEFIELWQDADPELQPRVEAARGLLAQLAAEGTG